MWFLRAETSHTKEKSRGLGLSLVLGFYFILLFDGIILLMMYALREYPVEKIVLYITFLNPVDLGRVMTLMYTDAAALMGYTGAVFQKFLNTINGTFIALGILGLWVVIPAAITLRKFERKNF